MIQQIRKAHKFRIYPNNAQQKQLAIEFGHARFVWNWALETRTTLYKEHGKLLSYVDLNRQLTVLKRTEYPWLTEATASCLTQKLIDQDKAFKSFFEGRTKHPRFKKKTDPQSVRYNLPEKGQYRIRRSINSNNGLIKLPKLGWVKVKWSQRVVGTPKMITISCDPSGRYFVSMSCEVEIAALPTRDNSIGVDVGIKDVVVTSDGFKSGAPKYTHRYARRLKLEQRRLAKKEKGSNRRKKQRQRVAKVHARIADSRRNFLHQTSSKLINENQVICLEDLNVQFMLRNRHLSKSIADSGLYELRRQIEYKAQWYGRNVIIIDRFAPSTKTCSECDVRHPNMTLRIRQWTCVNCGAEHDRDINAAKNILRFGTVGGTGTTPSGETARGAANKLKAEAPNGAPADGLQ